MKKPREIERKFLVRELPKDLDEHPHERIRQGYFVIGADGTEARVRRESGTCFLTVKSGRGQTRTEVELPIPARAFDSLWPLTCGQRVRKVRYRVPVRGGTAEVDVYRRKLRGLIVAEVEFDSEKEAAAFRAPDWFGEEVTSDERYSNQSLAQHGLPEDTACPAGR
jgi:CYTH domain-containing protein